MEAGFAAQIPGGFVVPALQLRLTPLLYPFSAVMVPLKVALCAAKIVKGLLLKLI
jgi:hypothetical protein